MFKARRLLVVLALAAGSLALLASTASGALVTTGNLILDPDAESNPAGTGAKVSVAPWVRNGFGFVPSCNTATKGATAVRYGSPGGFPDFGTPGPADHGFNFFAGGPNCGLNKAFLIQCIDLSAHAHSINAGLVSYDASAWLGGFKNQLDRASLELYFDPTTNCSDGTLLFDTTGYVTAADRAGITGMLPRSITGWVPHLTQSVAVAVIMRRSNGSYNDGYADSLSLTLTVHS